MSRSCHSATFSTAALALPRSTRARPVMRSDVIGLRLCGIALEPFCAGAKRLLDLAHLGALEVADLRRERSSPAPASAIACSSWAWRSRATTCVETGSRCSPSRASTRSSNCGEVAAYVPTAPEIAPTATCAIARSSRSTLRRASIAKPASFSPNVVGSACTPCVRPMQTVSTCSRARCESASASSRAPVRTISPAARSCRPGCVEHVAERQAEVNPAAGVAGGLAEDVDERRQVVVGRALALVDGVDGERRAADRVELLLRRPVHRLARRDLDAAPRLHARLVGPERADLRARVTGNHVVSFVSFSLTKRLAIRSLAVGSDRDAA